MERIVKQIDVTIWSADGSEEIAHFTDVDSLSHENGIFMVTLDNDDGHVEKIFYNSTTCIINANYTYEEEGIEMLSIADSDPFVH